MYWSKRIKLSTYSCIYMGSAGGGGWDDDDDGDEQCATPPPPRSFSPMMMTEAGMKLVTPPWRRWRRWRGGCAESGRAVRAACVAAAVVLAVVVLSYYARWGGDQDEMPTSLFTTRGNSTSSVASSSKCLFIFFSFLLLWTWFTFFLIMAYHRKLNFHRMLLLITVYLLIKCVCNKYIASFKS